MRFNLSQKEKYIFEHVKHIFSYTFQALLILFLITLLIQQFYPIEVNSRINVNWFMVVVIVFGSLSILFPINKIEEEKPVTKKEIALIIALGVIGAIIIFLKLKNLGWIGYVISILGGLIITLLSWLILSEKDKKDLSD